MNAPRFDITAPVDALHGYAVRPRTGIARLAAIDLDAGRRCDGVVEVVRRGDFVGVVAGSAEQARAAAKAMRPRWAGGDNPPAAAPRLQSIGAHGDITEALAHGTPRVDSTYRWPLAISRAAAIGWAVADWQNAQLRIWSALPATSALRMELAAMLGIAAEAVVLIRDAQAPARQDLFCMRQAAADAALMAHAVSRPVRSVFRASDLDNGGPKLALEVSASVAPSSAYRITAYGPPAASAPFALAQTGAAAPYTEAMPTHGALTPPYAVQHLQVAASLPYDVPGDTAAQAHVFAHESHLDELAIKSGADPVALRLGWLADSTGKALIERVAAQSAWRGPRGKRGDTSAGVLHGRGFAYASVPDIEEGRPVRTWSAWVADVEIDARTGDITISRLTVGHEREHPMPQAAGRLPGMPDDVAQATRQLTLDDGADDWGDSATALALPHASADCTMPDLPVPTQVDIVGALQGGFSATLPAAAALANAIHDATGVRLREPPFSASRIREGMALATAARRPSRNRRVWMAALAPLTALAGLAAAVMPWRPAIAPVAPLEPGFYSAATIERGRLVAAAGDCAVCHTAPGGERNAGGRALQTPFGTVYSTNITPDARTGIGTWSYAAFERAMREGIHQDGRRLYPAFPYTAFAKVSDADMQALYAYLMSAEPVASRPPQTRLSFPFNLRPLLAGWNLLFHRNQPFEPDPARSAQWNRGAYLTEGLGHCSACHSPRNALGAEQGGKRYLTGGEAEGWEAPALTALSRAPLPWTEEDLFQYLRTGFSARHGAAAGPMAPVVEGLRELPESDVRAIAHYIASFNEREAAPSPAVQPAEIEARSATAALHLSGATDRLYQTACAVCHQADAGVPQFGIKPSLALNTNLYSSRPDNVIQAVLHGVAAPPQPGIGYMPGFADSLDDAQVTALVHYLRARFAPDQPGWQGVEDAVRRIRQSPAD